MRGALTLTAAAICFAFALWLLLFHVDRSEDAAAAPPAVATYQGKPILWWARRTVQARKDANARARTIKRLKRLVRAHVEPTFEEIWTAAAIAYNVDRATLERKTRCESVNLTDFYNEESHASGPMQFLLSTWDDTPYGHLDVFNWLYNVMAGAWMHAHGRGGEWVCR